MPIQIPPLFPVRPELFGGKRPPQASLWKIVVATIDTEGRPLADVTIEFTDNRWGNIAAATRTDVNGRAAAELVQNGMGYRVTPSRYYYGFSPRYSDAAGDVDLRFKGTYVGKGGEK